MKSLINFVFLVLLVFCNAQSQNSNLGMSRRYIPELPGRTNRIEPPRSRQARAVVSDTSDPTPIPRTVFLRRIPQSSRRSPKN